MGIGSTVKSMLGNDTAPDDRTGLDTRDIDPAFDNRDSTLNREANNLINSNRTQKLPSATSPGASGKSASANIASERAMLQDAEQRARGDTSGYGTDAAAAVGGTLSGTHQSRGRDTSTSGGSLGSSKRDTRGTFGQDLSDSPLSAGNVRTGATDSGYDTRRGNLDTDFRSREYQTETGQRGVLTGEHHFGHSKNNKDSMPTANAKEDTDQLQPVTHERVRHIETEEISRVRERERHIHHIQHHTQPIVAAEELELQHKTFVHPVTHVRERHANKVEDNTLFEGQVNQFHDTLSHSAKERTIIDKGTTINETIHHHVHHVIQPVIEKETIDRQYIHTTIPIHEVTHEAPVVHQSQTHAPVPMEHFLQRGGTLHGATTQEEITRKVLSSGQCTREVDGVAETMERDLNLKQDTPGAHTHTHTHTATAEADLAAKKAAAKRSASANVDQPSATVRSRN